MWARLRSKLRFLFRPGFERELEEEMEFHRKMLELAKTQQGMAPAAAAASARRQFGNPDLAREDSREVWVVAWLDTLRGDLRYAWRTLAHHRAFAALAISSLALGIGANTAIYSFMDGVLLRALPVPEPESLVVLTWHAPDPGRDSVMKGMSGTTYDDPRTGTTAGIFPFPAFELFQKSDGVLSSVFAHCQHRQVRSLNVTIRGEADLAAGWSVSGGYFGGLRLLPAAGRLLTEDDDRTGAPAVVVVSDGFSRRRFGGAGYATGQDVLIDNLPFTVVGVTPPGFFGVDPAAAPDLYLPMRANELLGAGDAFGARAEDYLAPNYYWVQVMGRLRPGVSLAQAQTELAPAFRRWVLGTATNDRERANLPELVVTEGASGLDTLRRQYSRPLWVLMALVGLVLALACANVANLLLARAAARSREIALRLSIGAGRLRVVRQLVTESLLLASLGGVLGVLLAIWGMRFLTLLLANGNEQFTLHAALNWRVVGVAAALSLLTGVLFGLAPAIHATRGDLVPLLKEGRAGQRRARRPWRMSPSHALVVVQLAISLVVLVAAGLFVRTLSNLHAIELGFDRRDVLLFQVDAQKAGHQEPETAAFYANLRARLAALPGVQGASLLEGSLVQGEHGLPIGIAGAPPHPANRLLRVGPGFFTTMRIPVLAGRDLEERDRRGAPCVAVVNQTFAKLHFGDANPLGRHLTLREPGEGGRVARDMEIVGVSRNARYGSLTRTIPPVVYMPYDQGFPEVHQLTFALRTSGDPLRYASSVREIVRQADPRMPVSALRSQVADIDQTIHQEITFATLCTGLAILALVIASVGLYGTVSYGVARRTSEIGIRVALGAQRGRVVWMVLREVLVLVAAGLVLGVALALATSKLVASLLYGMKANDPPTLALAATILLGTALAAACAPAWKAARVDPMIALRQE